MDAEELEAVEGEPTEEHHKAEPKAPQESVGYWLRWLKGARKSAQRYVDDGKAAHDEYEYERSIQIEGGGREAPSQVYPGYYSRVKTLEPAYYSRTPKERSKRKWDIDDDLALTMTLVNDRFAQHLIKEGDVDPTMRKSVSDYIHTARATLQVVVDTKTEMQDVRVSVAPTEDPDIFVDARGMPVDEEILRDKGGLFALVKQEVVTKKGVRLAPAPYDEVLHTPDAKTFAEIREVAIYFCMNESEARARFKNIEKLPLKASKTYQRDTSEEERSDIPGRYLEGYEIYCIDTMRVYWVSEDYPLGFLDSRDDPLKLRKFFPIAPFIIDSEPSKNLYPTPAYIHIRPTLEQVNLQWGRLFDLIDGARRRALVDEQFEEIIAGLNAGDQEFIGVENLKLIIKDGETLANYIHYIPVQELINCMSELSSLEEKFTAKLDEWFGTPEIYRGASDPVETAAGLVIKSGAASDRFKYSRKQIQDLARDGIELLLDAGYQVYSADEIGEIIGFDYLPDAHKERFLPAVERLKNDRVRIVEIEIETDSTSFANEQLAMQRMQTIGQTITNGLATIGGMQNQEFALTAMMILLKSLDCIPGASSEFQDAIKDALKQLEERKKNPPQGPPPVDYKALELEIKQNALALQQQKSARELDQKDFQLALQKQKLDSDQALTTYKIQVEERIQNLLISIEQQRVQLESLRAQMADRESMAEEARLAFEAQQKALRPEPSAQQTSPQTVIINAPGAPVTADIPVIPPGL